MALTISTGFVVDDAIVVLENISRYLEQGMPRVEAAIRGAGEVGFTVVSISLSLIAVFAPLLFFGGHRRAPVHRIRAHAVGGGHDLDGRLADDDADDVRAHPAARASGRARAPLSSHGASLRRDARVLSIDVARRASSSRDRGVVALGHGRAQLLHVPLPHDLWPVSGAGHGPHHRLDPGRSEHLLPGDEDEVRRNCRTSCRSDPAVDSVVGFTGGRQTNPGFVYASLKPYAERKVTADEVVTRLRGEARAGRGRAALHGRGLRPEDRRAAEQRDLSIYAALRRHGGALYLGAQADPGADGQRRPQGRQFRSAAGRPADRPHDRSRHRDAARPHASAIDNTLYDAFGQRQVSTIYNALNQYHVVMEVAPRYWQDPRTLDADLRFDVGRQSDRRPADGDRRRRLRLLDRDGRARRRRSRPIRRATSRPTPWRPAAIRPPRQALRSRPRSRR